MERRGSIRISTDLHAVVTCPQFGLFRGGVANIAPEGVFVRTRNVNICINARVTLTLQDQSSPPNFFEAEGVVVHQNRNGFGMRLSGIDRHFQDLFETAAAATAGPVNARTAV